MNSVFPPPANRARHGLPALAVLVLLACAVPVLPVIVSAVL